MRHHLGVVGCLLLMVAVVVAPAPAESAPLWSIVPSPNGGSRFSALYDVSCASATSCLAVGDTSGGPTFRTMRQSWNGSTWTLLTSVNNGTNGNSLYGVSCASPVWCRTVGEYVNSGGTYRTLIESWKDSILSFVAGPNAGVNDNTLSGVSCVTTTGCQAVGYYTNGSGVLRTLIASWNGAQWSGVASPNTGTHDNVLYTVSCVSSVSCKAVGSYYDSKHYRTLIQSWNGAKWWLLPSPNVGTDDNLLFNVSCVSTTSCKAVGYSVNGSGVSRTLIESWNGSTWSVMPSPNNGTGNNALYAVSCVSTTSCKAVGDSVNASGIGRTLAESWNGSTWSIMPSPNNGTRNNGLYGVSCVTATSCTAVGSYTGADKVERTLIESLG